MSGARPAPSDRRSTRAERDRARALVSVDDLIDAGYRYALSLAGDATTAEDLLHDGWLALLKAGGPQHKGYLFRCIRTRFIDRQRRAKVVVIESVPAEELESHGRSEVDIEARIDARAERVSAALERLRPEEREALFLQAVEGYTTAEIAEMTARPRGTILSLLHRARAKLRADLSASGAQR